MKVRSTDEEIRVRRPEVRRNGCAKSSGMCSSAPEKSRNGGGKRREGAARVKDSEIVTGALRGSS